MFFLYAIIFAEWWKSWGFFREKDESVCFRVLNMSKKINSKLNKKCSFESLGGGDNYLKSIWGSRWFLIISFWDAMSSRRFLFVWKVLWKIRKFFLSLLLSLCVCVW